MNFKRKTECSYNHFPICDDNGNGKGMLLGVKKGVSADEATALINSPLKSYANISLIELMSLSEKERTAILSTIEEWAEKSNTNLFNGFYWNIVSDFIFQAYNLTLFDLAEEISKIEPNYPTESIYSTISKLENSPSMNNHIQSNTKNWVSLICAFCKISEDILVTGTGTLYNVTIEHTYDIKDVYNYYVSNGSKVTDLKK